MISFSSLYDMLDITGSASGEEIKSAFRKLAKIYHPDKNDNSPESEAEFISIHNAYTILSDPVKREEYDYFLKSSENIQSIKKRAPGFKKKLLANSYHPSFSLESLFSHINFLLWDIEIFLNKQYKKYFDLEFNGVSVQQYILKILTFIDKWVLYPAGYHDYFMEARQKKDINITDYINMLDSKQNTSGYKPFHSVPNYFYDIRKRTDKFLNKTTLKDLYSVIPGSSIRLIESIIETQNYTIHYMSSLTLALSGEIEDIQPYKHSNPGFKI